MCHETRAVMAVCDGLPHQQRGPADYVGMFWAPARCSPLPSNAAALGMTKFCSWRVDMGTYRSCRYSDIMQEA